MDAGCDNPLFRAILFLNFGGFREIFIYLNLRLRNIVNHHPGMSVIDADWRENG
jgi:hypothetical protein